MVQCYHRSICEKNGVTHVLVLISKRYFSPLKAALQVSTLFSALFVKFHSIELCLHQVGFLGTVSV